MIFYGTKEKKKANLPNPFLVKSSSSIIIIRRSVSALTLSTSLSVTVVFCALRSPRTKKMAARFLWASRAASHLRISIAQRGFSSGENLCLLLIRSSYVLMIESEIVNFFESMDLSSFFMISTMMYVMSGFVVELMFCLKTTCLQRKYML